MTTSLQFEGVVEGYVVNHLKKELWRISPTHAWEDAMQEARLIFWRCRVRYPDIQEDKHLMALFKTAWTHHFTDLAKKASAGRHVVCASDLELDEDQSPAWDLAGSPDNEGLLLLMIKQAPAEVQTVLSLFLSAPAELLELAAQAWRASGKKKAEGNKMINRCLGLPEDRDSIGEVHRYFLGSD